MMAESFGVTQKRGVVPVPIPVMTRRLFSGIVPHPPVLFWLSRDSAPSVDPLIRPAVFDRDTRAVGLDGSRLWWRCRWVSSVLCGGRGVEGAG